MHGYWITFHDHSSGYCEGDDKLDATRIAEKVTGKSVIDTRAIPYPANPILWQFQHPLRGACPAFCYSPLACAGRTSCPKNPACSE